MYVPRHFSLPEDYTRRLLTRPGVGNLVTVHDFGPEATMVPFYLDEERGALMTHLVRNNPQVTEPITGPGLVILDDVDAYVSPRWYATNEVKANVPTWDYITIHVRGPVSIDADPAAALDVARRLTGAMEHEDVLAYIREYEGRRLLVLCNFSDHDAEVPVPEEFTTACILIGNYDGNDISNSLGELPVVADRLEAEALHLRPYEAIALLA